MSSPDGEPVGQVQVANVVCTPSADWDCVVQDQNLVGDVVVPNGQRWLIGRNVTVRGSVRTHNGTIALRAGSSLRFASLDLTKVVGGGMHWTPEMANDFGIWIGQGHGATGRLDIDCHQHPHNRQSWSRTGTGQGWQSTDEYWIAPTAAGDYTVRRWYPGQAIPVGPTGLAAEIANVTRGCTITGPGHILVHSTAQHRVIGVRLERMGLITSTRGATTGRYALHFHHAGAIHGTLVHRVAAVNSGGRVFVPHASHGVSFRDNVSVNSQANAFWWDPGLQHTSHQARWVGNLVLGVTTPNWVMDREPEAGDAFTMEHAPRKQEGLIEDNVAVAASRHGFFQAAGSGDWYFRRNTAHNNRRDGFHFVDVTRVRDTPSSGFLSYRNGGSAFDNFGSGESVWADFTMVGTLLQRTSSAAQENLTMGGYRNLRIVATNGPAIRVSELQRQPELSRHGTEIRTEFTDCSLTPASGQPRVLIQGGRHPWRAHFLRCNLVPDDLRFSTPIAAGLEGTSILITNADGRRWEVAVQNRTRVVRTLP